ncbi:MAG: helix-turn-helix domain-containing protein [Bacteroidales bacterium]|nr:helix-turn-helix domain-containing protein [Bacteroidales bacterium]
MAQLKSEAAYRAALKRIDELLPLTGDDVPDDDPNMLEMDMLCDMVEEYEDIHYPIGKPKLADVIKLRMYERNLTQSAVAKLLGISSSRMSELMHGKLEPSYRLSRELCTKLNVEPSVVLDL